MKSPGLVTILVLMFFTASCSDNSDNKSGDDHFLKEKTETIDKAKEVEALMLKTAEDQAQAMEKQMQ
ncbi:MAG: hypothetical protein HN764_00610 [Gammaproteobacteria bacterium]|jgi:hypothetical protein|nr:hypothetical protein [Gammaproteobacteria bacterium]